MERSNLFRVLIIPAALLGGSSAALAEIPDPVRAMIDAAIESGDADTVATVITLAKQTNPDDAAALDAIKETFDAEISAAVADSAAAEELVIRNGGLFENWSGEGEIGAFRNTGNANSAGLAAGLKLTREGIDWQHQFALTGDYQRTEGVTTRRRYVAFYEPNYNLNDSVFIYGRAQYESAPFQGFDSRISASGGLGYRAIQREDMQLALQAGPAWRRTNFVAAPNEQSLAALAAVDFDWQVNETLKVTQDGTAFLESGNSTFLSITGLEAKLGSGLAARISYAVEHDTNPPVGAVRTDTRSRFTLVYGF